MTRRVKYTGEICVDTQSFTIGRQHAHELVEVHVTDRLFEVWVEGNLVKQMQRRRQDSMNAIGLNSQRNVCSRGEVVGVGGSAIAA